MTLLTPLGLLGLLGIIALIIIYIIRPNYQQKFVSTTFVWKLSLKYRKRKIPVSKLRNVLIIICQILILTGCALILAQPNQVLKMQVEEAEVVLIIDSSASMRTESSGSNRFAKAVESAIDFSEDIFANNGIVSVIVADNAPKTYLRHRDTVENQEALVGSLEALIEGKDTSCTYGEADIDGAIALCEDVFDENPDAQIYLFTDASYDYVPEGIVVKNVAESGEWNAGILDAYAERTNNYYSFVVEIACYGAGAEVAVNVNVQGVNAVDNNDEGDIVELNAYVECGYDETKTVLFINEDLYANDPNFYEASYDVIETITESDWIYTYKSVHIELNENDNFKEDDKFDIYNGLKEVVRIQYASGEEELELPNVYIPAAIAQIRREYSDRWDIQVTEVKAGEEGAIEDFDLYIFEHVMPATMPEDGVVLLFDPDDAPQKAGFNVGNVYDFQKQSHPLVEETTHAILRHVVADDLTVSRYVRTSNYEGGYETLLTCDGYPVLSIKDEPDSKVVLMNFSLHFSNIATLDDFPLLIKNIFDYFFPSTVSGNAFEVNENVSLQSRGEELEVTSATYNNTFTEFPAILSVNTPGQYTLTQTTWAGKEVIEMIYVKVPASESYISKKGEGLTNPYQVVEASDFYRDLMFYLAAAITALLFIEWWLSSRNNM